MNIHAPTPSLVPHLCGTCGARDSDPTWHRQAVASVSPLRDDGRHPMHASLTAERRNVQSVAVARRTDPSTSWEAARSVTGIRESQAEVLSLFRDNGPMTDEQARARYSGRQSLSGFRTRRAELVALHLLRDTGQRVRGSTGRRMIVWAAA